MYIPHAILTSPVSLRGLTQPYKSVLRPATLGFYTQRHQEMALPTKGRQCHFPTKEMALMAMATIHIAALY